MGHTSGLAKGFVMVAFITIAVIAGISAVGFVVASLFGGSAPAFIIMGFLGATCSAYQFYQPRNVSLFIGASGGFGGWVASLVLGAVGGFFGGLLGMVVAAIVTFVVTVLGLMFLPRSLLNGDSWRKAKS